MRGGCRVRGGLPQPASPPKTANGFGGSACQTTPPPGSTWTVLPGGASRRSGARARRHRPRRWHPLAGTSTAGPGEHPRTRVGLRAARHRHATAARRALPTPRIRSDANRQPPAPRVAHARPAAPPRSAAAPARRLPTVPRVDASGRVPSPRSSRAGSTPLRSRPSPVGRRRRCPHRQRGGCPRDSRLTDRQAAPAPRPRPRARAARGGDAKQRRCREVLR